MTAAPDIIGAVYPLASEIVTLNAAIKTGYSALAIGPWYARAFGCRFGYLGFPAGRKKKGDDDEPEEIFHCFGFEDDCLKGILIPINKLL